MIKEYLSKNNLSQEELAKRLGCTYVFVNNIANRRQRNIKIGTLKRICEITNLDMKELIDWLLEGTAA